MSKETKAVHSRSTPWWFYAILWSIPILFFLLGEGALRVFGYGKEFSIFVPSPRSAEHLVLNPSIAEKYFRTTLPPKPIFHEFLKEKPQNGLRVFVFGESSAAGYPYGSIHALSQYLKTALTLYYPSRTVEVINLGMAAISTYTMRDYFPEVLKAKPDLIVFYNGHNEYYGVMGAGSSVRFGTGRNLQLFLLWMQDIRLVQLLQNGIASFTRRPIDERRTLMARVIGESQIPFGSKLYHEGLQQFRENMASMLHDASGVAIPVILGRLVSNLRHQPPFVSLSQEGPLSADTLFSQANQTLESGDSLMAYSLFLAAKDHDALRFRAPEAMNHIIDSLGMQYGAVIAALDKDFAAASPYGIVGNELMCDHLHPTPRGYQLMGWVFFNSAISILGSGKEDLPLHFIDKVSRSEMPFSALDSTVADLRLRILKGSYPFVKEGQPNPYLVNHRFERKIDTLAAKILDEEMRMDEGHLEAVAYHLSLNNPTSAILELKSLITKSPKEESYFRRAGQLFLNVGDYNYAFALFKDAHTLKKTAISAKWMGQILVHQQAFKLAIPYLEESIGLGNTSDPQLYYNLSGAYYYSGNQSDAQRALDRALTLKPNYQDALRFQRIIQASAPR